MISHKLISFNKNLSNDFIRHIDSANNVCIYKLGSHCIPPNIIFPIANTVTLINCSRMGILNILNYNTFPNIKKINYLSTHPGEYLIYERFSDNIEWVFPNKTYDFYDYMVSAGRGKKDQDLIKNYITNKQIIDGNNGFDISFHFDLNIPGFGITNGEWWRSQFYEYIVNKHHSINKNMGQDIEEIALEKERVRLAVDMDYFSTVINN